MTESPGPVLYRGMTRTELDRAYSPSSMVPSIEPFLSRYASGSADARTAHASSRFATHTYGPSPEQTLDLFLPVSTPRGVLIFIHGGYWQALNASDASFPARPLTAAGYAYAAINYTLAPHATMDMIVEENRQALVWLWLNRQRLGIDAGPFVLSGHSAGAHLAAMMLTTDWVARGVDPAFVTGAVLLGGVYDLEPIRLTYVNDALGLDRASAKRNSPMFAKPLVTCPLVVGWAERDTDEFKGQSLDFAAHWGVPEAAMFEQAGVNHFDSLFDWCDPTTRLHRETIRLLQRSTT